jgi:hypothetical protein
MSTPESIDKQQRLGLSDLMHDDRVREELGFPTRKDLEALVLDLLSQLATMRRSIGGYKSRLTRSNREHAEEIALLQGKLETLKISLAAESSNNLREEEEAMYRCRSMNEMAEEILSIEKSVRGLAVWAAITFVTLCSRNQILAQDNEALRSALEEAHQEIHQLRASLAEQSTVIAVLSIPRADSAE